MNPDRPLSGKANGGITAGFGLNLQYRVGSTAGWSEVEQLRARVAQLEREVADYQIALSTANEHGDAVQEHLLHLRNSLAGEVRERQAAEGRLQNLVRRILREKSDLETLVQILIEQGDDASEEGAEARIDGLTGIANRRRFEEFMGMAWKRNIPSGLPVSLLICDIDDFKMFNDRYGHRAGDNCLRAVAAAIDRACGVNRLAARYGGEEFAVVIPRASLDGGAAVAETVRAAVAATPVSHDASPDPTYVTVSIGVACRVPESEDIGEPGLLVEAADRNLYLAKRRGKNRVVSEE